ncbi:phospholipid-binding protein MlaC [Aestuariibacter salexigens]|uniref:phospholipid-binding protein MlaC n=1 Tax=Aestuariibacter salexigens TaxID=226010 RepID=UPI0003F5AD82|nr:phospholipid-binding protein MlaC [Aestuariibacter salexigens]
MKVVLNKLLAITVFWVLATQALAQDSEEVNPYQLVQTVASATFDRIKREQTQIKRDPEVLRTIMEEELLPYIDYKFSAFMVLGKHFRNVSEAQRNEFVAVFREYLITTYAIAMGYYDDQTVMFEPESEFEDKNTVTVRAVVQDDGKPDIKVAFKVRKSKQTNEWKAYDMIAEGISLLSSKRSEFESILRQEGIDVVIAQMRDVISKPIVLNNDQSEQAE